MGALKQPFEYFRSPLEEPFETRNPFSGSSGTSCAGLVWDRSKLDLSDACFVGFRKDV